MSVLETRAPANGAERLGVQPPRASGPRRQLPQLVLGILLVAGCSLVFLVATSRGQDRTPVVSLANDVARGEVVEDDDLTVTYVSADAPIEYVEEDQQSSLVGQAALSDLRVGTIVTSDQFAEASGVLEVGDGTVGLALEPGQLPSLELAPGDLVNVVAGAGGETGGEAPAGRLVDAAEVVSTSELHDQTASRWVSLRATEESANRLAEAAAGGSRIQLVLVRR